MTKNLPQSHYNPNSGTGQQLYTFYIQNVEQITKRTQREREREIERESEREIERERV